MRQCYVASKSTCYIIECFVIKSEYPTYVENYCKCGRCLWSRWINEQ